MMLELPGVTARKVALQRIDSIFLLVIVLARALCKVCSNQGTICLLCCCNDVTYCWHTAYHSYSACSNKSDLHQDAICPIRVLANSYARVFLLRNTQLSQRWDDAIVQSGLLNMGLLTFYTS